MIYLNLQNIIAERGRDWQRFCEFVYYSDMEKNKYYCVNTIDFVMMKVMTRQQRKESLHGFIFRHCTSVDYPKLDIRLP